VTLGPTATAGRIGSAWHGDAKIGAGRSGHRSPAQPVGHELTFSESRPAGPGNSVPCRDPTGGFNSPAASLERTRGFEPATPPWQFHGRCLMRLRESHQCVGTARLCTQLFHAFRQSLESALFRGNFVGVEDHLPPHRCGAPPVREEAGCPRRRGPQVGAAVSGDHRLPGAIEEASVRSVLAVSSRSEVLRCSSGSALAAGHAARRAPAMSRPS